MERTDNRFILPFIPFKQAMFRIKLADTVFCIHNHYKYSEKLCRDYITDEPAKYEIVLTNEEIAFENKGNGKWSNGYLESLAVYRKICCHLLEHNTVLFHCSALAIDGRAFLFTAPSGTGKSTHTRLWREYFGDRVVMINDDKPLLKIKDKKVMVYGTPYGGKYNIQTNTSAEVCGIVILYQAPENIAEKLDFKQAFPMLLNQTYKFEKAIQTFKVIELVKTLENLPVYRYGCNISDEAVTTIYEQLKGKD